MSSEPRDETTPELKPPAPERFSLFLYVTGATAASCRAVASLKSFCEKHLKGKYALEVIDIYQQPGLAVDDQVLATPTLIRKHPLPRRRLVGDLSDQDRLLTGLGVQPAA